MNKSIYFIFLLFYCHQIVFGNTQKELAKFAPYEAMYVHTDRDLYFAGDWLHFKSYLHFDSLNILKSKVQYLSLQSENGRQVFNLELWAEKGVSNGSIQLPDTLPTGKYRLMGWTNNMIISKGALFTKQLIVINRFDERALEKISITQRPSLHISIEGNSLLVEKPNSVFVWFDFAQNSSIDALPVIENSSDTIQKVALDASGFGSFVLTPKPNSTYRVGDRSLMPLFESKPARLSVSQSSADSLSIEFAYEYGPFAINIEQDGQILWKQKFEAIGQPINQIVNSSFIRDGLFCVTLRNNLGEIVESASQFKSPLYPEVKIQTNSKTYKTREVVKLQINAQQINQRVASASLAITRVESKTFNSPSIVSYFKSNHTDTLIVLKGGDSSQPKFTNLSNGELFLPKHYWPNDDKEILIVPENHGSILSGIVINHTTKKPIENTFVVLTTPDSIVYLKYAETFEDGSFFFLIDDYLQNKSVYLNTFGNSPEILGSTILVREKFRPQTVAPTHIIFNKNILRYIDEAKTTRRAIKAFDINFSIESLKPFLSKKPVPLYSKASHTYRFSDYVAFDHFQEISTEVIPALRIRKERNQYKAKMVNTRTKSFFPGEPSFFLNGVYMKDIKNILHLSSKELERTETVSEPRFFGNIVFNGIVSLYTHKTLIGEQVYSGFKVDNKIQYPQNQPFPHVNQNSLITDSRIADLRETLLWIPYLDFNLNNTCTVQFLTSDIKGEYNITLEGITKDGSPFYQSINITVN